MSSGYGPTWAPSVSGARRDTDRLYLLDLLALAVAASLAVEPLRAVRLLVWLPVTIIVQVGLLRAVRLIAVAQELLLRSSYRDQYVPTRVMRQAERF